MAALESSLTAPCVERLLDAAERLVADRGAAHLTLEAVAAEAGVSKGGLLYHFPSKLALLQGMVKRHIEDLDARASSGAGARWTGADEPPARYRVAARLEASLAKSSTHRAVGAAMLAAAAGDPSLLEPCRARYRQMLDEVAELDLDFEEAAILHLAVDGLMISELLHLSPFSAEERERVVGAILSRVMKGKQTHDR